ncbi:MAG: UDP-N-acetylmuramoyl-L-alanyl-D-glutamate--2,6-diaminopimelate ligase [Candidatus Dadabacteria bacterium]|nr:MAG: UDP-N-acetylmuramoyl-L-alanyl-D-glutamate--2,6-diaminopimelate ligase [Candidatus Dadabacteria bacterium]
MESDPLLDCINCPPLNLTLDEIPHLVKGKAACLPKEHISSITRDSRLAKPGTLFVAIRGNTVDGHNFITEAVANGCSAILVERGRSLPDIECPLIVVPDTKWAYSLLCSLSFGSPSSSLRIIGVTGTNGKTTTCWFSEKLLNSVGVKCSRIGTVGMDMPEEHTPASLTTPDAATIHWFLRKSLDRGCNACSMEISSHGLTQSRADHVEIDVAVYTNLSRDHLDYHSSFEEYKMAKWKIFDLLAKSPKPGRSAVINGDCEVGSEFYMRLCKMGERVSRYGAYGEDLDLSFDINTFSKERIFQFRYKAVPYSARLSFIGGYNLYNLAAAILACVALGSSVEELLPHLEELRLPPGRLEAVIEEDGFSAYIDYSHTPSALEGALRGLREYIGEEERLIAVFGCGGERDMGKRALMGEVASRLADKVYITSDNPRGEDPMEIIAGILKGVPNKARCRVVPDRREAIKEAVIDGIKSGGCILIAGKGHEDYQIVGKKKLHFSDREELLKVFDNEVKRKGLSQ